MVKESLTLFTCITVGDERVLYSSVGIDCRSSSHLKWELLAALSLFVFAVLLPLMVFLGLWRVRGDLERGDQDALRQWGFLVNPNLTLTLTLSLTLTLTGGFS